MPHSQPATVTLTAEVKGVQVFANPMLEKVFFNLLRQLNPTWPTGDRNRVTSHKSGKELVMVCEDNGIGNGAKEKERIFDCGFGKNTGLGLFLSREILAVTGITIIETGDSGKGARFEITILEGAYRIQPALQVIDHP